MIENTPLPFSLPSVLRQKVTATFDGGCFTSDGGVMLLGAVEKEIGIADGLAPLINDPRNPLLVTHSVADILRARMLALGCGYEDADDFDHLCTDPSFKPACGRLPDSGADLCSQPTVSRWANAPTLRPVIRMTYAMVVFYRASYARLPHAVTLDRRQRRSMSFTATNSCRCSTAITTNAASVRSMSTTPRHRDPWRCCCGPVHDAV